VFNFKVSGIAGGTALALSLLVGLISGAGFFAVIARAFAFGAVFFILFCLIFWVLGQFVPELLSGSGDDFDTPGSRVNISLDGGPLEGAFPTGGGDEVDDIAGNNRSHAPPFQASGRDAKLPGMDQDGQSGYNTVRDDVDGTNSAHEFSVSGGNVKTGVSPADSGFESGNINVSNEGLVPDFDVLSGSFVSSGSEKEPESFDIPSEPKRPPSTRSGKDSGMGDFDPKELAKAIQTVLKKEDKG
jgi:hypothetical protein